MSFRTGNPRIGGAAAGGEKQIFDATYKNSALPSMRDLIFNKPVSGNPSNTETQKMQHKPPDIVKDHSMFFLPERPDEEDRPQDIINKRSSMFVKPTQAAKPSHNLTPHLVEIESLRMQLLQVKAMMRTQDELTLSVQQTLLRRMVHYLSAVKPMSLSPAEQITVTDIKADVDRLIKEQQTLVVTLRQDKLKQLVDIKPNFKQNMNLPHFRQNRVTRKRSQSFDAIESLDNPSRDHVELKPLLPLSSALKRSQTTRADRSQYFEQLANNSKVSQEPVKQPKPPIHIRDPLRRPKLVRQRSISMDTGIDDIARFNEEAKNTQKPRSRLQRSRTARTEKSSYFGELAKRCSNVLRRKRSQHSQKRRRNSVDSIPPDINVTCVSTDRGIGNSKTKQKQSFIKLDKSGQLVFDDKPSPSVEKPASKQISKRDDESKVTEFDTHNQASSNTCNKISSCTSGRDVVASDHPSGPKKAPLIGECHKRENPMLSSEQDFVEVDDLIHFIQNHKPPKNPFVRGFNAVNSASFRDQTSFSVENTQTELPGASRNKITVKHPPHLYKMGKPLSLDEGMRENQSKIQHVYSDLSQNQTRNKNIAHTTSRQNPSYGTQTSEILPTKPNFSAMPNPADTSQHVYANGPELTALNEQNHSALPSAKQVNSHKDQETFDNNSIEANTVLISPNSESTQHKGPSSQENTSKCQTSNESDHHRPRSTIDIKPRISGRDTPLSESFRAFDKQLSLMKRRPRAERSSDSSSEDDSYQILPKGKVPNVGHKPRLIKKPPRRSVKQRRRLSSSLSDMTRNPESLEESSHAKSVKCRPSSFVSDYDNVYNVPKSVPLYENIGKDGNLHNINPNSKPFGHDYANVNIGSYKVENHSTHDIKENINGAKSESKTSYTGGIYKGNTSKVHPSKLVDSDSVFEENELQTICDKPVVVRSNSDDLIYEQDQKRLREDLRRLTELEDELGETRVTVKSAWAEIEKKMSKQKVNIENVNPKRATLPANMSAPKFGRKLKCVIM